MLSYRQVCDSLSAGSAAAEQQIQLLCRQHCSWQSCRPHVGRVSQQVSTSSPRWTRQTSMHLGARWRLGVCIVRSWSGTDSRQCARSPACCKVCSARHLHQQLQPQHASPALQDAILGLQLCTEQPDGLPGSPQLHLRLGSGILLYAGRYFTLMED